MSQGRVSPAASLACTLDASCVFVILLLSTGVALQGTVSKLPASININNGCLPTLPDPSAHFALAFIVLTLASRGAVKFCSRHKTLTVLWKKDRSDPRCSLWGERLCVFPKHGKSSCTPPWLRWELSGLLKREELSNENTSVTSTGLFCRSDQMEDLQTSVWSVSKQDYYCYFFKLQWPNS